MSEMYCPNCGHTLVDYRLDRQSVGTREVVLQWVLCGGCRHVSLKRWAFSSGAAPAGPSDTNGQTPDGEARVRELQHAAR